MIGATFWNYLSVVFSVIAEQISWERWEGTLEYTMMAPVRRVSQLLGSTLFAIMWGFIHTTVVLTVLILFFGIDLSHADFLTRGRADAGRLAVDHRHRHDGRDPAADLGRAGRPDGVRHPVAAASDQRRVLQRDHPARVDAGRSAAFSPATYILDGVRLALIDGAPITSMGGHLLPLAVMAVVFIPLGVYVFGRAERYAKRTGKLKRVG